jgi:cytochrome P450
MNDARLTSAVTVEAEDKDLLLPSFYGTHGYPHSAWARLRREDPVHRVEEWAGDPYWAITRRRDIMQISRTPRIFRNNPRIVLDPEKGVREQPFRNLLSMDPPEPRHYRSVLER